MDRAVSDANFTDRETSSRSAPSAWVFGVGLAMLVILVGMPTLINAAARRSHDVHSTRFMWMLAEFDGIALVVFSGLVGAAILLRQRGDYHKRLMLLATLSLLGPAFGRLTAYAKGLRGDSDIGVLLLCVRDCSGLRRCRQGEVSPTASSVFLGRSVRHSLEAGHLRSQDHALDGSLRGSTHSEFSAVENRCLGTHCAPLRI